VAVVVNAILPPTATEVLFAVTAARTSAVWPVPESATWSRAPRSTE
jgi:hypothetical protein